MKSLLSLQLLLLIITISRAEANKKVVHELRRWESTGIVNCTTSSEFVCKDNPKLILPYTQRCDGKAQCKDKSDERKCTECRTPYSANGTDGFLQCITADEIRNEDSERSKDTIYPKCVKNERQRLLKMWRSGCAHGEMRCTVGSICLPTGSVCDGVEDCGLEEETYWHRYENQPRAGGDDEKICRECKEGARRCNPTGKCISSKSVCDGRNDCSDGSDEEDCTCETCNGALCGNGQCVQAQQVCDGVIDCQDASDEQDCPRACGATVTADMSLPSIVTSNSYRYLTAEACTGAFSEVHHDKCPQGLCDCRVAFTCDSGDTCISKAQVCDGTRDCYDGTDEENCLKACLKYPFFSCVNKLRVKCMSVDAKCDGVWDCANGSDEKKCDKCPADAHKCDGGCRPGTSRCDGVKDCKDGSDEKNCTCEECTDTHLDTYSCEATGTCMKRSAACGSNGKSKCSKPTAGDELFCVRQTQRTNLHKDHWWKGEASRFWE